MDATAIATSDVRANGFVFETLLAGPEAGDAVILLHGYPQSAQAWRGTLEWLGARGMRAIAPSLRGYSPGANPRNVSAYSMDQLVADVIAIADAQGVGRFHLVGHDWGGALAWSVAGAHPERLLSLTVLSTPHLAAMAEALRTSTQMLRSSYMGLFKVPRIPEAVLSFAGFAQLGLGCRISGLPREAWRRDREHLRRVGLRGPLNWYRGATRNAHAGRRITVPTLYIWGRHDTFFGRRAAGLTAKHVIAEYRFVELDAGHWIAERNADEFHARLGEQLDAHAPPPPAQPVTAAKRPARQRRAR